MALRSQQQQYICLLCMAVYVHRDVYPNQSPERYDRVCMCVCVLDISSSVCLVSPFLCVMKRELNRVSVRTSPTSTLKLQLNLSILSTLQVQKFFIAMCRKAQSVSKDFGIHTIIYIFYVLKDF